MHDDERDPADPATPSGDDAPGAPSAAAPDGPGAESGLPPDRRAFLNHLSRDAVSTAGRVAGLSSVFRRSIFAAGEAMVGALEPDGATDPRPSAAPVDPTAPGMPPSPVTPQPTVPPGGPAATSAIPRIDPPVTPALAPPPARAIPDPVATLTADQHAFLADQPRIILAANDPAGPPHVTMSDYHWDGAVFTLPTQQFTLRATNVESDPRVSLFLEAEGTSVAVTAIATVVYGDAAEPAMRRILERTVSAADALARWTELRASGDRMIIEARPTRFVWRRP